MEAHHSSRTTHSPRQRRQPPRRLAPHPGLLCVVTCLGKVLHLHTGAGDRCSGQDTTAAFPALALFSVPAAIAPTHTNPNHPNARV